MQKKVLLLAYFFICVDGLAQQYPFVHYTPKDGLVNSRVRKAYQDSKGRMYFITYGGLSVYDGARFRNYTTQNGLATLLVNDLLEVGDDSILVAVNDCGLNVLVRGQLKPVKISGEHCPVVNNFLKSDDGNIYCTADDGLYKLKGNSFEKLSNDVAGRAEPAIFLGGITGYRDYLIFTTNDLRHFSGLFLYDKKKNRIIDVLPQEHIFSLKKDRTGIIWMSTDNRIVNLDTVALLAGKLSLRKIYTDHIEKAGPPAGSIAFNGQNELYIASADKGIMRYSNVGSPKHIILPDQTGFTVHNFFVDREDVLWICHDGNGVYKLPNTKIRSVPSFYEPESSGLRFVSPKNPDTCWAVTGNNKIVLKTLSERNIYDLDPSVLIYTLFNNNKHLYAAGTNRLYLAPLPAIHDNHVRFKQIFSLSDSSSFGSKYISDPYGNTILFESFNIRVFQKEKLLFTYPLVIYDLVEGFYIDRNKQLWMASRGQGLQVFSIHPEDPAHYLQKKHQFIAELENASPRSMTVDNNEMLWIGTRHDGLMAFESKNDRLIKRYHFQLQDGLTDNFVTALAADRDDNILVGTQTGFDRLIKTKDGSYWLESVTKSNNVFSFIVAVWTDEVNNAFAMTNAGTVFQVEPFYKSRVVAEPQLLMEEIKINGKLYEGTGPLRLHYDQRNINFSIAAPSFINEKEVKYSYLLSGNKKWSDTSSVADITLLNLSPGDYTLQVKAFFLSTAYSPKELSYSFSILPPWWQTWWFRISIGIVLSALLIAGFRIYYQRKLERQKASLEKLQAIEKERTRIATDMHDDLGAGLSRIKFLSETIGIKKQQQQPIDEDITRIREYSHEMIGKMGEIVWALNEKNDSLNDLLSYTRSYAVEYLSQNGISCDVIIPENVPEQYVTGEFRRNIYLSVKEALHNIVKHARAGQVRLTIKTGKDIVIRIHDNGIGFSGNSKPFSNGLKNMEQRMKNINGSFEIGTDHGTIVTMTAPLGT